MRQKKNTQMEKQKVVLFRARSIRGFFGEQQHFDWHFYCNLKSIIFKGIVYDPQRIPQKFRSDASALLAYILYGINVKKIPKLWSLLISQQGGLDNLIAKLKKREINAHHLYLLASMLEADKIIFEDNRWTGMDLQGYDKKQKIALVGSIDAKYYYK